ncbi:MAG: right-handed parallel beta-helix repeat-containing protein [Butyrivibrio sp.]|nr:right-handed parallel beta-helix repeat-containing protein [Butyrivibrio sp.]
MTKKLLKLYLMLLFSLFIFIFHVQYASCSDDIILFDDITCLKNSDLEVGTMVKTSGYQSSNDGNGATYIIISNPTSDIDNVNIIPIQNNKFAKLVTNDAKPLNDGGVRNLVQLDPYAPTITQLRNSFAPQQIFYFSTAGSDNNDGLSPNYPKQNPIPYILAGNCQCLLKSGDIFQFDSSIKTGSNLIISTYGGKKRAAFSFIQTTDSTLNLLDSQNDIYSVSINAGSNGVGWISIDGAINWKRLLNNNLINENEYYYDSNQNNVIIKSKLNLEGKKLRYAINSNGINISNQSNVILENIELSGSGLHGISIAYSSNVLIQNCYVHDIGGGLKSTDGVKYGNGIQIWASDCNNIAVYKNIVTDCFDAGITAQVSNVQYANSSNLYFLNNLVERCNYGFESFHYSPTYYVKNVFISNNIFYDSKDITNGYRFTKYSKDYTAHLCLWSYNNSNSSFIFENNIGFKTQISAISYSGVSSVVPPIVFLNNTLISSNTAIKNPNQYTGDSNQYLIVTDSSEYSQYEEKIKNLINNYNLSRIIY